MSWQGSCFRFPPAPTVRPFSSTPDRAPSSFFRSLLYRQHPILFLMADELELDECVGVHNSESLLGLRIASVFIMLVCATGGALFPVLARRSTWLHVPKSVFDFAKYFGSGVIIGTAFIHLLAPALEALNSPCLAPAWGKYPYALALCMLSIFGIFILELVAFRWGTAKLKHLGLRHDTHGHFAGGHAAHGPEGSQTPPKSSSDLESQTESAPATTPASPMHVHGHHNHHDEHGGGGGHLGDSAAAQIVGIAILEFGVLLHSVLIGLTLAVDESFKILFVVILFHRTSRSASFRPARPLTCVLQKRSKVSVSARASHSSSSHPHTTTSPSSPPSSTASAPPIGIAVGLGLRSSYNPGSATASIVSGVLDSLSAGILIYTGLVELLAHEFLFNKEMMGAENGRVAYSIATMLLGSGVMALLGKWA
ncbi:ZIP-like iron-zinc transporter [Mycena kentingensis (nom. inval.)]|nr:ZIP-like iron-zinc transporter [Mycena kentingensis (nom. inval.)]